MYRFQNNFHFSLVTVTDAGVVVVDPINKEASTWLKDNLSSISDKPVYPPHLQPQPPRSRIGWRGYTLTLVARVIAHGNAPEAIDGGGDR